MEAGKSLPVKGLKNHVRSNVICPDYGDVVLRKPWNGEEVKYPDADAEVYAVKNFSFRKQS